MVKEIQIAIDGPAAAGKSTVAKLVAKKLSYLYIDTGAMYRALTYKALKLGADLEDEQALAEILNNTNIELIQGNAAQHVLLDGTDVTDEIRSHEVTKHVSTVSKHPLVRKEMVERQRELAQKGGIVMDGRDIGTHVLPNAEVKIFLVATVEERAKRRHQENLAKGFESDLAQLMKEIALRDKMDSEREASPLKKADDAIELDTTSLSIEEVVDHIMELVKERVRLK
ncbi:MULTISPECIES: (d)CMP kinase [Bacillus]|jgi:cytidylate kinase|uniref:Cytidylate kinase n=1 Tax=Bacillus smithii 7_3_47FAA TaxID=665952 RepID=G9QP83_9BACI|nr:(d)CMP kinase [Bacillus smithii]AKP47603.1 Cytidylate kinase [Bacillus smithii]EHL74138.1 cytidylate kinase [Bacillus smithii 7_3_47FAA]MED0658521.1 (d)CMP kinase [Bacillus smithii]MED1420151.1 (d)CMP kinase [Bacillus smithii]MED1455651.1 (d)CMP kinase [Bacillus smithii]